jgi:RNA polymerase sigma-70 factor (ECF subfamily)
VTSLPDADDIRLAKRGDRAAFARLVDRYGRRVHDLARRMLRDAQEAEDVTQQAFWNAWRALDRFDTDRPFRNWLLRIASNLCRNRIAARMRAKVRPPVGGEEAPPDIEAPTAATGPNERAESVREAIASLPERYRVAVILHYVQGLSLEAISEVTEIPVATVKTHLHRGRQALRERLAPPETEPPAGGTKG